MITIIVEGNFPFASVFHLNVVSYWECFHLCINKTTFVFSNGEEFVKLEWTVTLGTSRQ